MTRWGEREEMEEEDGGWRGGGGEGNVNVWLQGCTVKQASVKCWLAAVENVGWQTVRKKGALAVPVVDAVSCCCHCQRHVLAGCLTL